MRVFSPNSVFTALLALISSKAAASHTHESEDILDLEQFVRDILDELIDGAPTALDTLQELATALGNDPNYATTVTTALAGKVDKVTGKGLSAEDFTTALKSKLDGLVAHKVFIGATEKTSIVEVCKSTTTSGGNAVFHLTDTELSGGNSLFPNGNVNLASLTVRIDDVAIPHMNGTPVLSNGNKTLTVPIVRSGQSFLSLLGLNILTVASQAAANGIAVSITVKGD